MMKKSLFIFLSFLILLASCAKEMQGPDVPRTQRDSTVTIRFGVTAPKAVTLTKAMADQPQITSLHVAVFGGSGYLKEYVRAEPVELATHQRDNEADTEHMYEYTVRLSLTRSRIRVHFIANGPDDLPFDYEGTVIGQLVSTAGEDAYWQKVILPNGIYALDDEGSKANPPVYTVDPDFDLDENGNHIMAAIPLIRNFAKITVESRAENLTVKSFAIVNVPSSGTVAAYNPNTGEFMTDYADYDFNTMQGVYPGNMPAGTVIEKIIPTESDFINGTNGVTLASSADPNVYMYERPLPESNATFLLLYATYKDDGAYSSGYDCYYKIDLMSNGEFLPIYRNFRYKIIINSVYRPGMNNPTKAANGAGSGDISADTETASLQNLSDGTASIAVSYTEQVFTEPGTYFVQYRFVPDIENGAVQNGSDYVTFELLGSGASGDAIVSNSLTRAASDDMDTYRKLYFTTTELGIQQKIQKIRITGTSTKNGRTSKLYREVTIRLMPKQVLTLSCSPEKVNQRMGEKLDLILGLPKDLPASIFPLQFRIESAALSITPDKDNLPVESDSSIVEGKIGVPSFQFIKTLSRADYMRYQAEAEAHGDTRVSVPCHFKTNTDVSASAIYVSNPYFVTAHTAFTNYIERYFTRLEFSTMSAAEDEEVQFYFMMDEAHSQAEKSFPDKVYVTLNGLIPSETNGNLSGTSNPYVYTVSSNADAAALLQTLYLQATGETEHYSVKISAEDYVTDSLEAHKSTFTNPAFSITPYYGNGWPVNVSFSIPSDYEMPVGGIDIQLNLGNLEIDPSDSRLTVSGGKVYYHATATGTQTFKLLTSGNRTGDASVSLSHGDFEPAEITSTRQYLILAARGIDMYSDTYRLFYNGGNAQIYSDKTLNDQLVSYAVTRSGNYNGYNTNAVNFNGQVLDASSRLYFSYYSGYDRSTNYASATASSLENGEQLTFSTAAPGTHSVTIDATDENFSTSDLTETKDGATVTFASGAVYAVGGSYVRLNYNTQTFTVSAQGRITSITITTTGNNYRPTSQTASPGTVTGNGNNYEWTDSSNASPHQVTFTFTKDAPGGWFAQDRRVRISSITINYSDDD